MSTANTAVSPGGGVWAEVAGQTRAIAQFSKAARAARALVAAKTNAESLFADLEDSPDTASNPVATSAMTHAWLVVGPPGSGRSVAARSFAAALECSNPDEPGCGTCDSCRMVRSGVHPDVSEINTELISISVDEIKKTVADVYRVPAISPWRVIIIEDYDRISEKSSNVLLKAIEEPPERTVWVLCAPSATSVLPTVRSRCRLVQLSLPSVNAVAELLVRRDGIDAMVAAEVAAESGSHIGRARALAQDPDLRSKREQMLRLVAGIKTSSQAVWTAAALNTYAKEQAEALQNASERSDANEVLRVFGLEPDTPEADLPKNIKAMLRRTKDEVKQRQKRSQLDAWDRILEDITGLYRDVLMTQLGSTSQLINPRLRQVTTQLANRAGSERAGLEHTTEKIEAIRHCRRRLMANCAIPLAIEAMCVQLI